MNLTPHSILRCSQAMSRRQTMSSTVLKFLSGQCNNGANDLKCKWRERLPLKVRMDANCNCNVITALTAPGNDDGTMTELNQLLFMIRPFLTSHFRVSLHFQNCHAPLVDVLKVLGDQLGYFSPPSLVQAAQCVAAADLGYFQPIGKMPQVSSANRH